METLITTETPRYHYLPPIKSYYFTPRPTKNFNINQLSQNAFSHNRNEIANVEVGVKERGMKNKTQTLLNFNLPTYYLPPITTTGMGYFLMQAGFE